jgi:hypothetical protein
MEYKLTSHNFGDYIRLKSFAFNLIDIYMKLLESWRVQRTAKYKNFIAAMLMKTKLLP